MYCEETYSMVLEPYRLLLDLIVSNVLGPVLPRAAVFSVPKARYFSSEGSQTNISPSRMILFISLDPVAGR
jgi:hypothetical protein